HPGFACGPAAVDRGRHFVAAARRYRRHARAAPGGHHPAGQLGMRATQPSGLPLAPPLNDSRPLPVPAMRAAILDACSLASLQIGGPTLRSLGITSAIRGEGRSTVALAMTLVQRQDYDRRPLLLEMDLEHPCLGRRLGLHATPGLSELVRGEASLDEAIQWIDGIRVV